MNARIKFSAALIGIGIILAMLPLSSRISLTAKPENLVSAVLDDGTFFSVDQVARFVSSDDSTVQLIDVRTPAEFREASIPGSVNIPLAELVKKDPVTYLKKGDIRNIFYSNGDMDSNYAFIIARGLNFSNTYVMKGGMNEWYHTIMNSSFSGDRISARENALFETRAKAAKLFTGINSLPDSLKQKFIEAKQLEIKKLDGGCE